MWRWMAVDAALSMQAWTLARQRPLFHTPGHHLQSFSLRPPDIQSWAIAACKSLERYLCENSLHALCMSQKIVVLSVRAMIHSQDVCRCDPHFPDPESEALTFMFDASSTTVHADCA